jgi:hypothetical protein
MNLIGIAEHRLRNRPALYGFIDDDCDDFDEIDDVEERLRSRRSDFCGGLTSWDLGAAASLLNAEENRGQDPSLVTYAGFR